MIWPALEEVNFTPTSIGEPSFKLVCAGMFDAVNRLVPVVEEAIHGQSETDALAVPPRPSEMA